jgi:hypothetical protein
MNSTPHPREMRRYFYSDAAESASRALKAGRSRMSLFCTVPELNPEMDVYRVGTLLEWVREVATRVAEDGARVKVCVQGSMGQGVFQGLPLSLSGASTVGCTADHDAAPCSSAQIKEDSEVRNVTAWYLASWLKCRTLPMLQTAGALFCDAHTLVSACQVGAVL